MLLPARVMKLNLVLLAEQLKYWLIRLSLVEVPLAGLVSYPGETSYFENDESRIKATVDLSLSMVFKAQEGINGSHCTTPMVQTVSIIQDPSSYNTQVTLLGGILRSGMFWVPMCSWWLIHSCSVNGGPFVVVDQPNTGGGHVILSVPVKLNLRSGANSITFSANQDCMLWAFQCA